MRARTGFFKNVFMGFIPFKKISRSFGNQIFGKLEELDFLLCVYLYIQRSNTPYRPSLVSVFFFMDGGIISFKFEKKEGVGIKHTSVRYW